MAKYSSILAWRTPWTEEPGRVTVHGVTESDMTDLYLEIQIPISN